MPRQNSTYDYDPNSIRPSQVTAGAAALDTGDYLWIRRPSICIVVVRRPQLHFRYVASTSTARAGGEDVRREIPQPTDVQRGYRIRRDARSLRKEQSVITRQRCDQRD